MLEVQVDLNHEHSYYKNNYFRNSNLWHRFLRKFDEYRCDYYDIFNEIKFSRFHVFNNKKFVSRSCQKNIVLFIFE